MPDYHDADGVYSVDLSIIDEIGSESIPFQRKFLIDREHPKLYWSDPIDGSTPDNHGHLVANDEQVDIYVSAAEAPQ